MSDARRLSSSSTSAAPVWTTLAAVHAPLIERAQAAARAVPLSAVVQPDLGTGTITAVLSGIAQDAAIQGKPVIVIAPPATRAHWARVLPGASHHTFADLSSRVTIPDRAVVLVPDAPRPYARRRQITALRRSAAVARAHVVLGFVGSTVDLDGIPEGAQTRGPGIETRQVSLSEIAAPEAD